MEQARPPAEIPEPSVPLDPARLATASGEERRAKARTAIVKLAVLVLVVGGGFLALRYTPLAAFFTKDALLAMLERLREAWWTPLALIGLYFVVGPLGAPVTPLLLAGGAIFGPVVGSLYNFIGTVGAAVLTFLLGQALGRDFVVHFAGERLRPVERFLADQGFWTLVRTRFVPLPFAMVNYGAALAGVPLGLFAAAATVGLLPSVVVFTYFWSALASGAPWRELVVKLFVAMSLLMMLSMLPNLLRRLRRER